MIHQKTHSTLLLWQTLGASLSSYQKLIHTFGDASCALDAPISEWQDLGIHANHIKRRNDAVNLHAFERACKRIESGEFGVLCLGDANYPLRLAQIYDPPPVLFFCGDPSWLHLPQIAMIGARNPSAQGAKIAFDMADFLAQSGLVVTSGLAMGIDSASHEGALQAGASVGVMASGLDLGIDKPLCRRMRAQGCLVSELPFGTLAAKHTFPRRNRIVAGLSLAALVVEAKMGSGSLITARLANEMGKQVFAVPSSIDNPLAEGCHHLIREGATLIYHPKQVLDDIAWQTTPCSVSADTFSIASKDMPMDNIAMPTKIAMPTVPAHLQSLYDSLSSDAKPADALDVQMDAGELLAGLVELQILGLISEQAGLYAKNGT